jgi:hypothetical protein
MSVRAGAFALTVALERRRIARGSPRRIRRVDARTGADPSLRQTITLLGTQPAIQRLIGAAIPGPDAKLRNRQQELQRELERMNAEHADDPHARQEARMRLYRESGSTQVSCLPVLTRTALVIAVEHCPVPFLSQRRTLADLLAGTRIVHTRHPRRARWRQGPLARARSMSRSLSIGAVLRRTFGVYAPSASSRTRASGSGCR